MAGEKIIDDLVLKIRTTGYEALARKLIKRTHDQKKKLFTQTILRRLLRESCLRGFMSIIKFLLKKGAGITYPLINEIEVTGLLQVARFLQYAISIQEYNDINFDLLCSMFEPNSRVRDENIIYLLQHGADPGAYMGLVFSLILDTEFDKKSKVPQLLQETFFASINDADDVDGANTSKRTPIRRMIV